MKCGYCGKEMKGNCFEPCNTNPTGFCIPVELYDPKELRGVK